MTRRNDSLERARILAEEQRYVDAVEELARISDDDPAGPEARRLQATALLALGRDREAAACFERAAAIAAEGGHLALFGLGRALRRLKRFSEAAAAFDQALAARPDWWPVAVERAETLLLAGLPAAAESAARQCLAVAPADVRALRVLAVAAYRRRRFADAAAVFATLTHLCPDDAGLLFAEGRALALAGSPDKAMTVFDLAARQGGGYRLSIYLARYHIRNKHLRRAEIHLRQAVALRPRDRMPAFLLVRVLLSTRRGAEALALLRGMSGQPTIEQRRLYALALQATGRTDRAVARLEALAAECPDDPQILFDFATVLMRANAFEAAEGYLRTTVALRPDWPQPHRLLAACLLKGERLREAAEVLTAALACDEDHLPTRLQLARTLNFLGERERARAVVDAVPGTKPKQHVKVAAFLESLNEEETETVAEEQAVPSAFATPGKLPFGRRRPLGQELAEHVVVVSALVLREVRTLYARRLMGYLWAFLRPLMMLSAMYLVFKYIRMRQPADMSLELFLLTGLATWYIYMDTFSTLSTALKHNRIMLSYPSVRPIDCRLAGMILEYLTDIIVVILFGLGLAWMGTRIPLDHVPQIFFSTVLAAVLGAAVGVIVENLRSVWLSIDTFTAPMNSFLFLTSGIFFSMDELAPEIQYWLRFNPLLHIVDYVRNGFMSHFPLGAADIWYPIGVAAVLTLAAFMLDSLLRHRVLAR